MLQQSTVSFGRSTVAYGTKWKPDKADYSQCSLKEKNGEMAHQVKNQRKSINADSEGMKTDSPKTLLILCLKF